MTDPRPRPQYGEYASQKDQAAAAGLPAPSFAPPVVPPAAERAAERAAVERGAAPSATGAAAPRRWDIFLSYALLAYGAVTVVAGFFQFTDLNAVIEQVYTMMSIGTYTPTALAGTLGIVINVSNVVLFVITVAVTMRALRKGRLAFYLPIIGGAVAYLVSFVCLATLMLGDPAFTAYVGR
ncbi:DUF6264 family protein [Lacisediminihabitans sp.]|jgi:hypothetical protein|uniref:DUF6264 family protein n=1 Tax=Lacisediminihabitans sp. TaxID=2787631 RepID=UPI002F930D34